MFVHLKRAWHIITLLQLHVYIIHDTGHQTNMHTDIVYFNKPEWHLYHMVFVIRSQLLIMHIHQFHKSISLNIHLKLSLLKWRPFLSKCIRRSYLIRFVTLNTETLQHRYSFSIIAENEFGDFEPSSQLNMTHMPGQVVTLCKKIYYLHCTAK